MFLYDGDTENTMFLYIFIETANTCGLVPQIGKKS